MASVNVSQSVVSSSIAGWTLLKDITQPYADFFGLHALPLHIHQTLIVTMGYQIMYKYVLPFISSTAAPARYQKLSGILKLDWDFATVSLTQSLFNSGIAIVVLLTDNSRNDTNWQERVWGYHPSSGLALGLSTGYFLWHLVQEIVHRNVEGYIFVVHGIACMVLCGIGFRPFGMWYLPVFLIAECPNIFVSIERLLDKNNLRHSRIRSINRNVILATYLIARIIPSVGFLILLSSDLLKAIQEPNPRIRSQYGLGGSTLLKYDDSDEPMFSVQPLPLWLALIPLTSMVTLNILGFYWFFTMLKSPFNSPIGKAVGIDSQEPLQVDRTRDIKERSSNLRKTYDNDDHTKNEEKGKDLAMPVAIIGMGCRLAGGATSPEKLWEMVSTGRDAWSEIPTDRFKRESFFHPNGAKEGATNVRGAHFLEEDISLFDAPFFNISFEEAKSMDPQLRLQLECTYEALENAGIPLASIANSDTSVYSGIFARDYHESMVRDIETLPRYFNTGTGAAMFSNRLSYFFDLKGPSMTVDTGCSTSIVALHLACQSLKNRESKMSIIGGNNLMLNPDMITAMSSFGFVSPDGRSYAFDHRASGYGRGEGVTSIVIKPLEDALRDGDPIRAVIRNTCLNQDGKTAGITLPSQEAQEALFRSAYEAAGLDPSETPYIEAHGTGTQAGDPLEAGAISSVFGKGRTRNNPVYIGSVKTNIGHLEAGSGLAGILKATLVLEKGAIPPSANFERPNPKIPMEEWNIKIPQELMPWPNNSPRRVSVNSFGYGGTNGNVILEHVDQYLLPASQNGRRDVIPREIPHANHKPTNTGHQTISRKVFVLSGKDEDATRKLASNLAKYAKEQVFDEHQELENLAYTLAERRTVFPWMSSVTASSLKELIEVLEDKKLKATRRHEGLRIGFVFTGQGAQWHAMGRELFEAYPVFKETIITADKHMKTIGAPWSIMDELRKDATSSHVNEAVYSQPLCTALQIALVNLLKSWNVLPTAVTSHSSGEVAAAYAAGALSLESAITVSYFRGFVTTKIKVNAPGLEGGMIAVGLSREEANDYILRINSGRIVVGCVNSPTSVTVSGDLPAILEMQALLEKDNVFVRKLPVDAGYHSHHMEVIANDYRALLGRHHLKPESWSGNVSYSSSVTGNFITSSDVFGANYWIENMVNPVLFIDSLRNMILGNTSKEMSATGAAIDAIVEIGPHSGLAGPIKQIMKLPELRTLSISYTSCLIRKRDAVQTMQETASLLLCEGYNVNLKAVNFPLGQSKLKVTTNLPPYPWTHKTKHWHESHLNKRHRFREDGSHDLLGVPAINSNPLAPTYRHVLRPSDVPWVRDHIIQGSIIYPAAGYICMAIEGFRQSFYRDSSNLSRYKLRDVEVLSAAVIPDTSDGVELQLSLRPATDKIPSSQGWYEFHVYSVSDGGGDKWTEHCTGYISAELKPVSNEPVWSGLSGSLLSRSKFKKSLETASKDFKAYDPEKLYELLRTKNINHGPIFQNIETIRIGKNQSLATILIPDTASLMPYSFEREHAIHPTTLDTILQAIYPVLNKMTEGKEGTLVPTFFNSVSVSSDISSTPGHRFEAFSTINKATNKSATASISVSGIEAETSPLAVEISGFRCDAIGSSSEAGDLEKKDLCFQMHWDHDISTVPDGFLAGTDFESKISKILNLHAHKYPGSSHLVINAKNGTAASIISKLVRDSKRPRSWVGTFDITYHDTESIESGRIYFKDMKDIVSVKQLDILSNIEEQSFKAGSYDMVILDYTYLSDTNIDSALMNTHKLLKEGGRLLVIDEQVSKRPSSISDGRTGQLKSRLLTHDFQPTESSSEDCILSTVKETSPAVADLPPVSIFYGNLSPPEHWKQALESCINSLTGQAVLEGHPKQSDGTGTIFIFLVEVIEPLLSHLTESEFIELRSALTTAKGVLWLTRGGSIDCQVPESSLATGLLRVLRAENTGVKYATLDLDPESDLFTADTSKFILEVVKRVFLTTSDGSQLDLEYAHRSGGLMVPRLIEDLSTNEIITASNHQSTAQVQPFNQTGRPLRMEVGSPGLLDSMRFIDDVQVQSVLPTGFVEVEPKAFGLNFRDVMVAMGHLDETIMGYECSGVITRVGTAVPSDLKPGDRVCVMMKGNYASLIQVSWQGVAKIPENMAFDIAASIPMVFSTAYYCLNEIARLQKGESILIHAAAGGVGQAAIMLARLIGAEIYVTVGTKEKREFVVETYGIADDHIFSSRNTSFAAQIMSATNDKGVDVVLNCLAGAMLQETWNCIAALGRFVEIGKRDFELNNHLQMAPFTRNVTFASVDLMYLMRYKPDVLSKILTHCMELLAAESIHSVQPITVFSMSDIEKAFRLMQSGKHRGKIIIAPQVDDKVMVLSKPESARFSSDASYLIVGGVGGIGRSISRWMVKQGVKHLILLSRSGLTRQPARDLLNELSDAGCDVAIFSCDVTDKAQLQRVVDKCAGSMPAIRGVIQAAMALKDYVFEQMPYDSYTEALYPKVHGTWNLHKQFPDSSLDFFIMLSSAAGIGGNPGQANYAAGSTFLDAIARYRASKGMPGVTLDLGVIQDVGYVAENKDLASRLERSGHVAIKQYELLSMIESAIVSPIRNLESSQIISGLEGEGKEGTPWMRDLKFSILQQNNPAAGLQGAGGNKGGLPDELSAAKLLPDAVEIICRAIAGKLSQDFMISVSDIDFDESLGVYGVDSLVAVELRNWILRQMKADTSIFDVLQSKSLRALGEKIVTKSEYVKIDSGDT